ncbi:MAG: hypothetical protein WCI29_00170 [Actinomycetes bacterium]
MLTLRRRAAGQANEPDSEAVAGSDTGSGTGSGSGTAEPAAAQEYSSLVGAFPRVNLIPDTIAAEAKARRAKMVVVGATIAAAAVIGSLYTMAAGEVDNAQQQLDSALAQSQVLASQTLQFADIPKVQMDVDNAKTQQYQAMGGEVLWSSLLNDLSLTMPAGTALTEFKASVDGIAPVAASASATSTDGTVPPAAPATNAPKTLSVLGNPGIGIITYAGEARTYADVAAFLDSLGKQKTLLDPYPNSAQLNPGSSVGVSTGRVDVAGTGLTFSTTVTISANALSHRYDLNAGKK